jgi:hypothetical protein
VAVTTHGSVTAWSSAAAAVPRTPNHGELAVELALTAQGLATVYRDGSGLAPEDVLRVDPNAAATIAAYTLGDVALRHLAPEQTPVLWPEHFDLGITVAEVDFGVSPGDDHVPVPYAYVGPSAPPSPDAFWNASFGAWRPLADLGRADAVLSFFRGGPLPPRPMMFRPARAPSGGRTPARTRRRP